MMHIVAVHCMWFVSTIILHETLLLRLLADEPFTFSPKCVLPTLQKNFFLLVGLQLPKNSFRTAGSEMEAQFEHIR